MDPQNIFGESFTEKQKDEICRVVAAYLQGNAFSAKKVTDTPTDNNMVTPRGYVNMSGTVANRPNSSVATVGQRYFATDTNIPMTYSGTNWRNGTGSVVAST